MSKSPKHSQIAQPSKTMHQKSPALIDYHRQKHLSRLVRLSCALAVILAALAARLAYLVTN